MVDRVGTLLFPRGSLRSFDIVYLFSSRVV
jgi:hypothetical protein